MLVLQTAFCLRAASIRGFATGDAGVKLWQVQGILHTGQLLAPIHYPGAMYDPEHLYSPFVPPWFLWQNGQPYSEYTSPFIWLSAPLYGLFGHAGLLLVPWLGGALIVIVAAWLAWRASPTRWAALVPIVIGVSSPLLIYSLEFWEHTLGTLLALLALAALIKANEAYRPTRWLIAAGAALGLSLTMRAELYVYPIAVVIGWVVIRRAGSASVALEIYSLRHMLERVVYPLRWVALGGLIIAGPWWLYETITWGSPLGPRLAQNIPGLGGEQMLARLGDTTGHNEVMLWPIEGAGSDVLPALLIGAVVLALGLAMLQRIQKSSTSIQRVGRWLLTAVLIGSAALTTWRLTQEQRPSDLLTTFPLVLMLLVPISSRPTHHIAVRWLVVTALAYIGLVLIISPFEGGIQWGPRFLLPAIALLAIVVVTRLDRAWGTIGRSERLELVLLVSVLFIAGAYSTWRGVDFMHRNQVASEFMSAVIGNSPERVVVADSWFIPQSAPYAFADKIWLLAEDEQAMFNLLQLLRKTTSEPSMAYVSALSWTHIDPVVLMGPRLLETGERVYVDTPRQYFEISRYLLLK
ncbi:MAG: hypothetical protein HY870_17695 [Chloroflexi bacterium]|nr:hypothetical protein [Chloroflexota bacterium]